ncbi:MAG: MFS transporter [Theionarchaea archaeon]|nr:MAG: hypothetical protein AYK19_20625 [Theionarchaea archaeon DG-70-1]MBU7030268.1 MFS transporter [Theionarchaea archaeon]
MERRMLGVFSAISFTSEMRRGMLRVFLILYLYEERGASLEQAGIIFALIIMVNALSQIFWGWISDRIAKRKHFIILGEGIPGIAFLFLPKITDILALAAVLITAQILWSMAAPAWKALIAEHSRPGKRGGVMGKITTFGGMGSMLGIYIVGDLIVQRGYAYLFYFGAFCMFLTALIALLLEEPKGLQPSRQKLLSAEQVKTLYTKHRPFSMFTLLVLLVFFAAELIERFIPVYVKFLGGDIRHVSWLFILEDGVETALLTPMGWYTDKVGRVKMLQVSLAMRALAVLFFAASPTWRYLFPVMMIWSAGWSAYNVSWFAVLSSLTPRGRRGTYMGFHSMITSISSVGSVVGGSIADGLGLKVLFFSSFAFSTFVTFYFIKWLFKHDVTINESEN